jgi:hypothetical protein
VTLVIGIAYVVAILACFHGASARPQYRGPLIALGVVLLVPIALAALFIVYVIIAFSRGGAHFG